ncbi:OmpH family outer membrane protein [Candidatus Riflebacteria bacterium]
MQKFFKITGCFIFCSFFLISDYLAAANPRFGVIDVKKIFLNYKETKSRKNDLAKQIDKLQAEINKKKVVVDQIKKEIESLGKTLKPGDQSLKAKKTLNKMRGLNEDYRSKMKVLKEMYKKYSIQLQNKEEKEILKLEKELEKKVKPIIKTLAKKRKYFGIFEKRSVFYGGEDITQEILDILNR